MTHPHRCPAIFLGLIAGLLLTACETTAQTGLVLTGGQHVDVKILRPPSLDGARHEDAPSEKPVATGPRPQSDLKAEDSIRRLFVAASWTLHADGTFDFTPSPERNVRDDLFPLTGHSRRRSGGVELRAHRESPVGASVSIDGMIRETPAGRRLEAVYAVVAFPITRIAIVRQELGPAPDSTGPASKACGLPVPSTFEVSFSARMDGQELPPQAARLKVLAPEPGSVLPCTVDFQTAADTSAGSLHWSAPVPATSVGGSHRITFNQGKVTVEMQKPDGDPLAPFWTAASPEPLLGGLAVPYSIRKGTLSFRVQGERIEGEVEATGAEITDPAQTARSLRGTFRGQRQGTAASPVRPAPAGSAAPLATPRPAWTFEITLHGTTEAGAFDVPGLLMLLPYGSSGYEMSLTTSGEARNGWLRWAASIEGDALAWGEPVTVRLKPSDSDPASQTAAGWFTLSSEPGFQGRSVNVIPKEIALRLAIREGKFVEGDIQGEGLAMARSLTPSTYRARLRGRVEVSPEEVHPPQAQPLAFTGTFDIEDGSGGTVGTLSASQERGEFQGTLHIDGKTLRVLGRQDGGRADFVAPDRPGSSLFLRAVAQGESFIGLWQEAGHDTSRPLLARLRRVDASVPPSENATAADAGALRQQGMDLVRTGRCQAARAPLEKALAIYQREAGRAASVTQEEGFLLSESSAARLLTDCALSEGAYDRFVVYLQRQIGFLKALESTETARRAARDQADTLRRRLTSTMDQLRAFTIPLRQLREWDAGAPSPSVPSALSQAIRASEAVLEAFLLLLKDRTGELERLATTVSNGEQPAGPAFSTLSHMRADLRSETGNAKERLTAVGNEILRREPQLREARDRYSQLFAQASEGGAPRVEALAQEETRLLETLRGNDRLGELEKELVWKQAQAGITLQTLAGTLHFDSGVLARNPVERHIEQFGTQAVQTALVLAERPELWRRQLSSDIDKNQALTRLQAFFGQLIVFLLDAGQEDQALLVAEAARSRALLDLLAGRPEIEAALEAAPADAGASLPSPTAASFLSLEELLGVVRRRGSTTLEYLLTDEMLVIWVIAPTGMIETVTIPFTAELSRVELARSIHELQDLLAAGEPSHAGDGKSTTELLRRLHSLLIAPIPSRLLPRDTVLTIIPHGELFSVPFAALQDGEGRFLIESYALVHGTSIAVLKYTREDRERLPSGRDPYLLALVNPSPLPPGDDEKPMVPLDHLAGEFDRIARFYPEAGRQVLAGSEANKAALFQLAGKATELYLVTHGNFFDKGRALDSYIALAGSTPQEGHLRVPEVFRLRLSADLVLLWACETGRGEISADGVQGLSRAFTWAGAPSLMLSLWKIPEMISLQQMYGFHLLWKTRGYSKAEALRRAQVEQMTLYSDQPGLWAGFVLFGEAE